MCDDSYVETTTEGWFDRLGGSLKGIFGGVVLAVLAIILLFWNEGRAVDRAKALEEGAGAVVSIQSDSVDFPWQHYRVWR